ncbi:NADPH-dependent oxidoreductase [Pseudomonas ogarae]|uniref:NADPH-dependent oxidoreductase n=1 Tax=Pseudomonas ogarae (strain DSM 112162 / CECT 30235 / F113) TaxID=1114970 RepID=UPI001F21E3F4|nr:NADPH-dependent oxidoreductase [Pseudomonas ogarae]
MAAIPNESLRRRYGDAIEKPLAPSNAIVEALLAHRSVRHYLQTPVPPGILETIIAAAQSAATSSNLQSWTVINVESPQRRQRFAEIAGGQQHIVEAPLFLVWVADLSRAKRQAQRHGAELAATHYLESLLFSSIDVALAAQNAVVASEALGLSSVYIGALRNDIAAVAEELQLPQNSFPVFGLCVGYADPAKETEIKPRLPQAAVLHHEVYSTANEEVLVDEYSARLQAYYRDQQLPILSWPELVLKRLQHVVTLGGRVKVAALLRKQGFSLD